jgi:hypothetical protein
MSHRHLTSPSLKKLPRGKHLRFIAGPGNLVVGF